MPVECRVPADISGFTALCLEYCHVVVASLTCCAPSCTLMLKPCDTYCTGIATCVNALIWLFISMSVEFKMVQSVISAGVRSWPPSLVCRCCDCTCVCWLWWNKPSKSAQANSERSTHPVMYFQRTEYVLFYTNVLQMFLGVGQILSCRLFLCMPELWCYRVCGMLFYIIKLKQMSFFMLY